MTVKSRVQKLEKATEPEKPGAFYVVRDDRDHVLVHPGGYMTKAEFEALTLGKGDIVFNVVHVGVDLSEI